MEDLALLPTSLSPALLLFPEMSSPNKPHQARPNTWGNPGSSKSPCSFLSPFPPTALPAILCAHLPLPAQLGEPTGHQAKPMFIKAAVTQDLEGPLLHWGVW